MDFTGEHPIILASTEDANESHPHLGAHQARELSRRTEELLRPMMRLLMSATDEVKFTSLVKLVNVERSKQGKELLSEPAAKIIADHLQTAVNDFIKEMDRGLSDQQWLDGAGNHVLGAHSLIGSELKNVLAPVIEMGKEVTFKEIREEEISSKKKAAFQHTVFKDYPGYSDMVASVDKLLNAARLVSNAIENIDSRLRAEKILPDAGISI